MIFCDTKQKTKDFSIDTNLKIAVMKIGLNRITSHRYTIGNVDLVRNFNEQYSNQFNISRDLVFKPLHLITFGSSSRNQISYGTKCHHTSEPFGSISY